METQRHKTRLSLIQDCGIIEYKEALDLQHRLVEKRCGGEIADTIILAEHPPVITMGARDSANVLLADGDRLAGRNIRLVRVRRGGGTTAHNPGQLVVYPVVDLGHLGLDISSYVRKLENAGIKLLAALGIEARSRPGLPGIWVQARKIASIGIRVRRRVTFHGMAININNDLEIFDLIVPCGLKSVRMTSVAKEAGGQFDMERVKKLAAIELTEELYGIK